MYSQHFYTVEYIYIQNSFLHMCITMQGVLQLSVVLLMMMVCVCARVCVLACRQTK